jgi:Domain of Unknown Function with PDB structure (DUF3858)/Domain of Unknown Function with PDB structure (DUF3857)/Transglutaminase-like superfamily
MRFFKILRPTICWILMGVVFFVPECLSAQDTLNISFGKVTVRDFYQPVHISDSSAGAVILADIGRSYYEANSAGSLGLVFTRFMRVKILNKNGFRIGSYEIGYNKSTLSNFIGGTIEAITELKGTTFNMEKGNILETNLDSNSVFDEKFEGDYKVRKFAMPALKEGSIYDVTYTIKSVFEDNLRSWSFQSDFPCLWSEYQIRIPESYHYRIKIFGDSLFDIATRKIVEEKFDINTVYRRANYIQNINLSGKSNELRWVKTNEPAIVKEPYVNSVRSYIDRISFKWDYFQLNALSVKYNNYSSWKDASVTYLSPRDLRESLGEDNFWLDRTVGLLIADAKSSDEKIRTIYYFIRNHFTCYRRSGIYPHQNLQDVYKKKSGTEAEINLLLVAMIRHANIPAHPAILSTRENGVANYDLPMMDEYNYLICVVDDDENEIKLDASWPKNPYGRLVANCFNGGARVLDEENPKFIPLLPDSLVEKKQTQLIISADDSGVVSGNLTTIYGYEHGYQIREAIKKESEKEYFRKLLAKYSDGVEISNVELDSLENYDFPLTMHYDLIFQAFSKSDIVYFKPVMDYSIGSNPFTSLERHFPIEMPYKTDYVYLLSMDIPKGFQVEEIPKSERIILGDNLGVFDYIIQQNQDNIQMQIRMKLNKTLFSTAEYSSLREFFSHIVRKESDQIVFKKTKS